MTKPRLFDILDHFRTEEGAKLNVFASLTGDKWKIVNGNEYCTMVDLLSLGFIDMGITKGDTVATIMKNCPEWNYFDIALLQIGAVQVPVYPTISDSNYEYIFNDAKVKYIIVSDENIYSRFKDVLGEVPSLDGVFSIVPINGTRNWMDIVERGKQSDKKLLLDEIKKGIDQSDLASLIYTSGTTGAPKGVMLSHRNIVSNCAETVLILQQQPVSRVLSFLPLCHVFERIMNYTYQQHGATIYYCDDLDRVSDFIRLSEPEMFAAVPRVLEKTYDKILAKGRDLKGIKRWLFFWATALGERYEPWGKQGWWYNLQLSIARKLIFSKWKAAFGGQLKAMISGGASLQERLARVFWAAGFKVVEGYGLSETSPVIAVGNFLPDGVKVGTVGPALPGVEVKIAEDGEILCKGPNVMMGYYKRPDLDAEIFDQDGWLHTGDIGHFEGRFLKITDRKKEMFKTSGGKYVAPQPIENKLKETSFIENALVVGDGKHFAAAIIIPNFAYIESWCHIKGIKFQGAKLAIKDEAIRARISKEIDAINLNLDKVEQIKKFSFVTDNWTVETGELSPTMKLKRKFLQRKYAVLIEQLYI